MNVLGSRPYQEIIANVQHTMFSDYGSPLALEPRPQGIEIMTWMVLYKAVALEQSQDACLKALNSEV